MLHVRLDEELEQRLAEVARAEGREEDEIARDVIRRYVDRHDAAFLAEARRQSLRAAARGWSDEDKEWEALAAIDDRLDDLGGPDSRQAAE